MRRFLQALALMVALGIGLGLADVAAEVVVHIKPYRPWMNW